MVVTENGAVVSGAPLPVAWMMLIAVPSTGSLSPTKTLSFTLRKTLPLPAAVCPGSVSTTPSMLQVAAMVSSSATGSSLTQVTVTATVATLPPGDRV